MLSYPELYILGRQVDGVYVEYLHGSEQADLFFDYTIARDERNHMNKTNGERWRLGNFKVWQPDHAKGELNENS